MTATTLTRPAPVVREVIAAQLERLAHWYGLGEFAREATWAAVDRLSGLPEDQTTFWFEELVAAVARLSEVRAPGYDYLSHEAHVRDPEVLETRAQACVDEAIDDLIGGAR